MERETQSATAGDSAAPYTAERTPSACAFSDCTADVLVRVLYEDEALLAVNKTAGLVTHPAYKHPGGTLCDAVFTRQATRGEARPWLLHRLDRETSGVVLFAKTECARRAVVRQFERHTVGKRYLALLAGVPNPPEGMVEAPLARDPADRRRVIVDPAGKPSATRYRIIARADGQTLVLVEPLTGRTHQIRAHLTSLGTPLAGDRLYQPEDGPGIRLAGRVMLHAWQIAIRYPSTGESFTVTAPPPADFIATAERLKLGGQLTSLIADP